MLIVIQICESNMVNGFFPFRTTTNQAGSWVILKPKKKLENSVNHTKSHHDILTELPWGPGGTPLVCLEGVLLDQKPLKECKGCRWGVYISGANIFRPKHFVPWYWFAKYLTMYAKRNELGSHKIRFDSCIKQGSELSNQLFKASAAHLYPKLPLNTAPCYGVSLVFSFKWPPRCLSLSSFPCLFFFFSKNKSSKLNFGISVKFKPLFRVRGCGS